MLVVAVLAIIAAYLLFNLVAESPERKISAARRSVSSELVPSSAGPPPPGDVL